MERVPDFIFKGNTRILTQKQAFFNPTKTKTLVTLSNGAASGFYLSHHKPICLRDQPTLSTASPIHRSRQ